VVIANETDLECLNPLNKHGHNPMIDRKTRKLG